ncbi:hypothetical protein BT69DRAFT_1245448, partial [Atractiella rhizophila]
MTKASIGHWLYDRFKEEWFLWRGWLLALLGDMLGSTKFNGCTGHQGKCGCRFCWLHGQLRAFGVGTYYYTWRTVRYPDGTLPTTSRRPVQYSPYDESL